MIKHYHENKGDATVWHDGSLADCPETEWTIAKLTDGTPARLARGMSISLPPERFPSFRIRDEK
jgi:hypothetical protein